MVKGNLGGESQLEAKNKKNEIAVEQARGGGDAGPRKRHFENAS